MNDTRTSAFAAIKPRISRLAERCIDALMFGAERTPDEIADYLGETPLAIRPRITELKQLGRIRDTGKRRANASGRMAKVWGLAA